MTSETSNHQEEPAADKPVRRRRGERRKTVFNVGGWGRRLTRLWGFLGFVVLVVILARHVILPFVFALLIAYILAPLIERMSQRPNGTTRMPRGLAIIICYLVLISFLASFVIVLMPRLSKDLARIGREAPGMYEKLDQKWLPELAHWLEKRFPSMAAQPLPDSQPVVSDVPLPPGTAFVITPLPDGRMAVQLAPSGLHLIPRADGGLRMMPTQETDQQMGLEDKLRAWMEGASNQLQDQAGDFVRFGQALVSGLIRGVFSFFLVLMVTAFILIDLEKLSGFVRSLVPEGSREDYDFIAAGINRGLAGVIRGQLMICLVNGILTYIGLIIFSVKYPLILAVVAAIMSLIPIFGSILSTIPIVLAALVSGEEGLDIVRGVIALAWIVGIHFLEANILNPKIIGTAAKINPVLVIFALIVGEHSYGLVGALLAVPVTSMIQVLFLFFRNKAWRADNDNRGGSTQVGPDTPDGDDALDAAP
jgi:predicted PurR-regulated permease PerM